MAEPDHTPPEPSADPARDASTPEPPPKGDRRARVQQQRRHIEDLSGRDPLEGGIDD